MSSSAIDEVSILGDFRELPFRAVSFHAVWASAPLIHLPYADAADALRELARVATAGALPACQSKTAGVTGWADDMPRGRR
jgi:ubiquinone/menaquinone biosynthesis C-methylase UbiE